MKAKKISKHEWHSRIQKSSGWSALNLKELWTYRDLFGILAGRDIKLRYKQTFLGIAWVILQPLLTSGIFAIIFGVLADLPSEGTPYFVFAFAGSLPWNLFSQSMQRAGSSLVTGRAMIEKVYFPRMILPIASSVAVLVDFFVGLGIMGVMLIIFQIQPTINLLALPLLVLINLMIAIGVSLWISAFSVHYRDFIYALPFLISAWMYASPIAYSATLIPDKWKVLYSLNPMVGVIDGFRWALLGQDVFPLVAILVAFVVGLIVFISGAFVFKRIERGFADVI
ncbi:MAG: ABC transporter permease [Anaerolineales bacterium]|nr:ABC transporter permease [Anaerolineales bacterium]